MCPLQSSLTKNDSSALEMECRGEIRTLQRSSRSETMEGANILLLTRIIQKEPKLLKCFKCILTIHKVKFFNI